MQFSGNWIGFRWRTHRFVATPVSNASTCDSVGHFLISEAAPPGSVIIHQPREVKGRAAAAALGLQRACEVSETRLSRLVLGHGRQHLSRADACVEKMRLLH